MYQGHIEFNPLSAVEVEAIPAPMGVSLPNLSFLHELHGLPESSKWPRMAVLVPWAKTDGVDIVDYMSPSVAYSVYALNERLLREIQRDVTFGNPIPYLAIGTDQKPDLVRVEQLLASTQHVLERIEVVYPDQSGDAPLHPVWLVWVAAADMGKGGGSHSLEQVAEALKGHLFYALQHPYRPQRTPQFTAVDALAHQDRMQSIARMPSSPSRQLHTYQPTRSVAVGDAATNAIEASKEAAKSRYYAALSAAGICAILALAFAMDSRKSRK
jgi:hypothetical protein